jgi:uncharacterized membrane protein YsdA (DUF1294 family)/cold shock CspA family protein
MRLKGTIKTWNDERGFGFISPSPGGQDVFVHIKAFRGRGARPEVGQAVTFEIASDPRGRKRATAVEPLRRAAPVRTRRQAGPAQWGTATYFVIGAFLVLYLVVSFLWTVPAWIPLLYIGASVVAFVVYWADKAAARADAWRIPETTLLVVGLAGGWPGAIVAQQVLRHKSTKAPFRAAFWATVVVNVVAFVALTSPLAKRFV